MDAVNCLLIRWSFDRCYFKTSKIKGLKQWSRSEMFSIEKSMLLPAAKWSLISSQFLKISISASCLGLHLQVCHLTHTVFRCVVNNCFVCCEKKKTLTGSVLGLYSKISTSHCRKNIFQGM